MNIRTTGVSGSGSPGNPPETPRNAGNRAESTKLFRRLRGNKEKVAEGEGIEPSVRFHVHRLAICCITALPSLRKKPAPGSGIGPDSAP